MKFFYFNFSKLSRQKKITMQLFMDTILLSVSFLGAALLQIESLPFVAQLVFWGALVFSIMATLLTFWAMGLYRCIVRFVTGNILVVVGKGAVLAGVSLYAYGLVFEINLHFFVPINFALFSFLLVGGLRFAARTYLRKLDHFNKRPVIIYGAGAAGLQLLNSLFHSQEFAPIALIDDDPSLHDLDLAGLCVYSSDKILRVVQETGAEAVLLAIPSVSRARRLEIVSALEDLNLEIKTIPSMTDIIHGNAKISELRTISADDFLGRDPVAPVPELLSENITGLVVMVSGAGGSIGSELCRQILNQIPSVLVLYEISEIALYTIEAELTAMARRSQYQVKIVPILGSVQNGPRIESVLRAFKVNTIYHAAAYKHVPLVEENVAEGILNNVFGTLEITRAAQNFGVANFILISTDKAVRPTNVMGATKRIAELICQASKRESSPTIFSMVRFGNVLGSSGSVIPHFLAQIKAGGPITVTHKDINRYFMTMSEAAQLVIQAGALGKGGDVFVLDMGEPVKIMDLAFSMVKLHGLTPYMVDQPDQILPDKGDIPIFITGLRKGEKLYEELLIDSNAEPTKHPRIMTKFEVSLPYNVLEEVLDRLLQSCKKSDFPVIFDILHELPLNYAPLNADFSDLVWKADQDTEGCQSAAIKIGVHV